MGVKAKRYTRYRVLALVYGKSDCDGGRERLTYIFSAAVLFPTHMPYAAIILSCSFSVDTQARLFIHCFIKNDFLKSLRPKRACEGRARRGPTLR